MRGQVRRRRRGAEGAGGGISRESGRARTVIAASERGLHSPPPRHHVPAIMGLQHVHLLRSHSLWWPSLQTHTSALASHSEPWQGWMNGWVSGMNRWVGGWVDGWSGSTRPLQWISREVARCGCTGFNSRTTTLTHRVAAARMHTIHQRKE